MRADLSIRLPLPPAPATLASPAAVSGRWESRRILGVRIDACTYDSASEQVLAWAGRGESRTVACANVHVVMEARDDESFAASLEATDLVTPDGMPLVWGLKRLGINGVERVYGPDFTELLCAVAAAGSVPVGFYGGDPLVLPRLVEAMRAANPQLDVRYAFSPPFREATPQEDAEATEAIASSGARIVFVGLGCPKQERWIADHRGRIPAVLVGVGAAFDFLAGAKRQAPRVMQRAGMEWAFRLCQEPKRLWKRYAKHNPRFVGAFARQLVGRENSTGGHV